MNDGLQFVESRYEELLAELRPLPLPRALETLSAHMDALLQTSLAAHLQGERPACAAGCGCCCHQTIVAPFCEIAALFFAEERHFLDGEVRRQLALEAAGLQRWRKAGAHTPLQLARLQFSERLPCGLLTADQRCAFHDRRPFICRNAWALQTCTPDSLNTFGFENLARLNARLHQSLFQHHRLARFAPASELHLAEGLLWLAQGGAGVALRHLFTPQYGRGGRAPPELRALPIPSLRDGDLGPFEITGLDERPLPPSQVTQVLEAIDGRRDLDDLMAHLVQRDIELAPDEVQAVIRGASELGLLRSPDLVRLPVEVLGESRFECLQCGGSCRTMRIGPLSESDVERLETAGELSADLRTSTVVLEHGHGHGARFLAMDQHGACPLLESDSGLCRLHRDLGPEFKPYACRAFPRALLFTPGSLRLTLRAGCRMRHRTWKTGPTAAQTLPELGYLLAPGHGRRSPFPEWVTYLPHLVTVDVAPDQPVGWPQFRALERLVLTDLAGSGAPLHVDLSRVLRGVYGMIRPAGPGDEPPQGQARLCIRYFCQLVLAAGSPVAADDVREALERLVAWIDGATGPHPAAFGLQEPEVEGLARELIRHQIWALERLSQFGSLLPALVAVAFHYVLASWLAMVQGQRAGRNAVDDATFNTAFEQIDHMMRQFIPGKPGALVVFAAAPEEVLAPPFS